MAVKYGDKSQTFLIKKYLSFKIEQFGLSLSQTFGPMPVHYMLTSKSSNSKIKLHCIIVYFYTTLSPSCFHSYLKKTREIHLINTKSASLGCLHVTACATTRYGINSITKKCISIRNEICLICLIQCIFFNRRRHTPNLLL